ncbi:MAG: response regulator [Verrucomicrobiota bacterium]|jgi:DNA-binding NtrC family response regulator
MSQLKNNGVAGSSPTIFVVDDEPMLLNLAETILGAAGFRVHLFHDPKKALSEYVAAKPPPDVVITDYAMAGMSGLDLIRECKRLNPQQKTILLSGTVNESIYANSPIKPDHFLTKPYQIHKLVEVTLSLVAS